MNNGSVIETIGQMLRDAQNILIVSHQRPDGDAVGSILGLGLSLQQAGKTVQMVLEDGVPHAYRHLNGSDQILRRPESNYDLSITLDCSDPMRTGKIFEDKTPDINIDHHVTNLNFARVNLVEPNAVATAEVIAGALKAWDLPMSQPVAEALLNGLISDTLGFRTSNISPSAMRMAADLMEAGANLPVLYHEALIRRSYEAVRYWYYGLENLQKEDRLVWTSLKLEDRAKAGYAGQDDADLVNVISAMDDIDITVIFVEQRHNRVKVSWRGAPGWDVSQIALRFGGGGHAPAAGATIEGELETVMDSVLQATRGLLNGRVHDTINETIPS
jgi:phosphoesterase RecJ-like protein